jgi:hypothetical protein
MKHIVIPVFVLCAGLLHAQAPANWQSAERAKILSGISAVPKVGAPGPVAIWGNLAFPVIAAADGGKAELALAAAAGYGKGRALIFGHNSYLDSGGTVGDLLVNAVKWVANKEKAKVGVKDGGLAAFLKGKGFTAEKFDGPLSKKTLGDFDAVIVNAQGITSEEEGAAVQEFIKNGGGFIAGMTGWAFEQTSGGKTLSIAHGLNKALMPIGIAFTDSSGFGGASFREFEARTDLPRMMNAFEAISAIKKQREGGPALTAEEINQGANAIQIAMAAQPPGRNNLQQAVMSALGEGGSGMPTAQAPLTQEKNSSERIRLGMETRVLKLTAGDSVKAHPAATAFPGQAPAEAPRVTKDVSINPSIPGWASTGLWVNAGDPITVKVPAEAAGKGFAVRIGCHTDTLYHLEKWSRAPDISRSVPLETSETKTASAFGGLLYIEVPARAAGESPVTVNIAGVIEAPLFVLEQDDDAKWNNELKKRPAPWAEFACGKVILTCPSENARKIANPTQLMEFWTRVVEAQDEIANQAAERKRPERIVADVQISAGYMHSGYPIMVPTSAADEMITLNKIKFPGWGYYHELGHNHQRGDFTFEGTGEVTNNVLGLYVYHAVLEKDPYIGHSAITRDAQKEHIAAIKKADNKFALWKKEPFLALTTYAQLVDAFGWDAWRKYLHSFSDTSFGPAPKSDDEKRDQFLVRYSKISGKNLGPFFEAWGIPVSSSAKSAVDKLEPWMPRGM